MSQGVCTRRAVTLGACLAMLDVFLSGLARPIAAAPSLEDFSTEMQPSTALSLTILQQTARRSRQLGKPLPDDCAHLFDLNVLRGFTREPNGELLLLGDRDPTLPRVHLDDLTVTLRNAYGIYQGVLGVSIDPDTDAAEDPWRLQKVRVIGMPSSPSVQMAGRMVALDYELKKVAAGLLKIGTVPSLWDLRGLDSLCEHTGEGAQQIELGTRFWFEPLVPPRPRFVTDDGVVIILRPVGAQLLTEQQLRDKKGLTIGTAPALPEAERFARLVTEQLLATSTVPRYARLRQDFRIVEFTALLRAMRVPAEILRYLLTEHPLQPVAVPRWLGGIRRDEQSVVTCDSSISERATSTQILVESAEQVRRSTRSSRGGVLAQVRLEPDEFVPERRGRLATLRARARLAAGAWSDCVVDRGRWDGLSHPATSAIRSHHQKERRAQPS